MGYHAELVLLYPVRWEKAPEGLWCKREIISFGYITRLQKLTDKSCRFEPGAHQRAGVCVMAVFLEALFEKLKQPQKSDFAPPILVYDFRRHPAQKGIKRESVDLGYLTEYDLTPSPIAQRIGKDKLVRHNKVIAYGSKKFVESLQLQVYHPIGDAPFPWESCATLAKHLEQAEEEKSEAWQELEKDPVSLALAKGWRAYLYEVGKVEARALFFFPRHHPTY